jgi:hypothetical protein
MSQPERSPRPDESDPPSGRAIGIRTTHILRDPVTRAVMEVDIVSAPLEDWERRKDRDDPGWSVMRTSVGIVHAVRLLL